MVQKTQECRHDCFDVALTLTRLWYFVTRTSYLRVLDVDAHVAVGRPSLQVNAIPAWAPANKPIESLFETERKNLACRNK